MSDPKKHDLKYLPVDDLVPNAWNPQSQNEAVFSRLVDEITDVGFIDPCEVVSMEDGTYRIIGGEHRWQAAKKVGLEEIPCVILQGKKWKDEDLQKFVTIRLNTIRGKVDPDKFMKLYEEMAAKYGQEPLQQLMGYADSKAFEKMVSGVRKGLKKSMPPEMMAEFDKAAKDAKTGEDLEKIVQMLFAKYGDTVELSFMIFTYGKQEHFYVQMDSKMRKAINKVADFCKMTSTDINKFMGPIIQECMKKALQDLEVEQNKTSGVENP